MECKYKRPEIIPRSLYCINRNIVECKYRYYSGQVIRKGVLIETLWNVNTVTSITKHPVTFCINRNIVECKFRCRCLWWQWGSGINRNIVECKFQDSFTGMVYAGRINRNIVECKFYRSIRPSGRSICINRNIVECKSVLGYGQKFNYVVLIETLWNVNLSSNLQYFSSRQY